MVLFVCLILVHGLGQLPTTLKGSGFPPMNNAMGLFMKSKNHLEDYHCKNVYLPVDFLFRFVTILHYQATWSIRRIEFPDIKFKEKIRTCAGVSLIEYLWQLFVLLFFVVIEIYATVHVVRQMPDSATLINLYFSTSSATGIQWQTSSKMRMWKEAFICINPAGKDVTSSRKFVSERSVMGKM